jgi:hypothetical protein
VTDTIYIGGIATGAKSYSSRAITAGPSSSCLITYSFKVIDKTSTDVTIPLASFISLTPVSPSTTNFFTVSVAASTDTSLATNAPYIITVTAALTASLTKFITDTVTLTVKNSCVTPIVATDLVKNYNWVLLTGDTSFSYDVTSLFNCPGEPINPTF